MAAFNKTTLYSIIWDESFWFPKTHGVGWKDLENRPGSEIYYPEVSDLNWSLPLSLVLLVIRYLWELLVVVPIGLRLGLTNNKRQPVTPIPQLEVAFKKNKKPEHGTIQALSKQTDLTVRQIEVWFRKRLKQNVLTPMQKFQECSWHLVFYTTYFIYGVVILWNKPYTWKTILCWKDWPKQNVSSDIYWYYLVELSFYWSLVFTLFKDNKRKDFVEMMVHHFATIVLMYFSWLLNFVRVGSLVLVVHDAADSWLSLTKMSIYLKKKMATDIFFGIFLVVWIISRLIIYPCVILYCTTVEPVTAQVMSVTFGAHQFFNFFLYLLQVLHIIWTYLIFRIIYRKMVKGNVEDVRSDSEEDADEPECEENDELDDTKNAIQNGVNGNVTDEPRTETKTTANGPVKADGVGVTNGFTVAKTEVDGAKADDDGVTAESDHVGNGDLYDRGKFQLPNGRPVSPSKIPRARRS